MNVSLGKYPTAVEKSLNHISRERIIPRIWQKDYTVWRKDPTEISNRLGWLDCVEVTKKSFTEINSFLEEIKNEGYSDALLMGMGGRPHSSRPCTRRPHMQRLLCYCLPFWMAHSTWPMLSPARRENGIFDVENTALRAVYVVAAILFGLAPTILAVILVRVVSVVDRIPEDYTRPVTKREIDWIRTVLGNMGMHEFRASDAAELLGERGKERTHGTHPEERSAEQGTRNRGTAAEGDRLYQVCPDDRE